MTATKNFILNSASNYIILFLKLGLSILIVPLLLHAYGEQPFGIFTLIFGLSATIGFLDFGAGKSILKYSTEYKADNNREKFVEALEINSALTVLSSLFIFLLILLFSVFAAELFSISPSDMQLARVLFILSAFNGAILFLDYLPANILSGFSYFKKRNKVQLIPLFLNFLLLIGVYLIPSLSLITYCSACLLINFIFLAADMFILFRLPEMKSIQLKPDFKKLFSNTKYSRYSMTIFLLSAVGFLGMHADRYILSSIIDITAVVIYTILTRPYFLLKTITASSFNVILPILVKTNITDNNRFNSITEKFTQISFILLLSVVSIFTIFFESLLNLWLSTDVYDKYAIWGILAMINLCIPMLYGAVSRTLVLTTGAGYILRLNSAAILLNFIISLILTKYIGWQGVIIGTTIQMIVEFGIMNKASVRYLKFPLKRIFSKNFSFYIVVLLTTCVIMRLVAIQFYPLMHGQLILLFILTIIVFAVINYFYINGNGLNYLFKRSYWRTLNNEQT